MHKNNVLRKFKIVILISILLCIPNSSLAYINSISEKEVNDFANKIQVLNFEKDALVTKGDFIKMLIDSAGLSNQLSINNEYKFNDVPGESEKYAEKARQLGLVYFNPANPNFGYSETISIKKAIELSLKFYGLNQNKFVLNPSIFETEVFNYNKNHIFAPLIERSLNLGLIKSVDNQVNLSSKITTLEALSLIYKLLNAQLSRDFLNSYNPIVENPNIQVKTTTTPKIKAFSILEDVYNRINTDYYLKQNVDNNQIIYGAIEGMVNKLNDPYTVYQIPEIKKTFTDSLNNKIEGIGASLEIINGNLTVISPLSDSPAYNAGILPGDIIQKINSDTVVGLSLSEAVDKIQGKAGTKVKLSILRGTNQLEFEITRASILMPNVTVELANNGIAVVKIRNFGLGSEDTFKTYSEQFAKQGVKAVIFDLRNNPGGYLGAAIEIASNFAKKGDLITSISYGNGQIKDNYAEKNGDLSNLKVAVLINKGSASASEILAASLKDNSNAILVGETTYGKGSVQELVTYSDNSALKITVAHWKTPLKKDINGIGIKPDYYVTKSEADKKLNNDPVLNRALLLLK